MLEQMYAPNVQLHGDSSHDPGEHLWSRGQAEAESLKMQCLTSPTEAKKPAALRVYQDLEIGVLQVDQNQPITTMDNGENCPHSFHSKLRSENIAIQKGEIYY